MSALPARVDLEAYRGDSWSQGFRFKREGAAVDLSDSIVESQARTADDETYSLLVTLDDAVDGRVRLRLPSELPAATYEYDVEVDDLGVITTWVRGTLIVTRDVTNEHD